MARYAYVAKDKLGKTEKGVAEAKSKDDLIISLQARGLMVISVEEETQKLVLGGGVKGVRYHSRVTLDDLIIYARQLATLLGAGIPLLRSLGLLSSQISSKKLYAINEQIKSDIEAGKTLKDALSKHPKVFSRLWIYLVETGELSGNLPETLRALTSHLESAAALRSKVQSAMVYPSIVASAAVLVVAAFLLFFVPIFQKVFTETGVELPGITVFLIKISMLFKMLFFPVIILVVLAILGLRAYANTPNGRLHIDGIKLKLAIFGMLYRMQAEEEFASGMSLLLKSGVPILHALEVMGKSATNAVAGQAIDATREFVREGKTLAEPLNKSGVFAPIISQMIAVGEETGELPQMLEKVSAFTKERLDTYIGRLTTMLEPLIIIVLAVVVLFLAVAIYMPIFQMIGKTR